MLKHPLLFVSLTGLKPGCHVQIFLPIETEPTKSNKESLCKRQSAVYMKVEGKEIYQKSLLYARYICHTFCVSYLQTHLVHERRKTNALL